MRLSDAFRNLGRPVVYYPSLVKPLGTPNAVILFCQLLWWQDKTDNELGVYKTPEEIEFETGLTYKMQLNASEKLVKLGLLIKTHLYKEHKVYFKIDFDVFDKVLGSLPKVNYQRSTGSLPKVNRQVTKGQSVYITESTTENTTHLINEVTERFNTNCPDLPKVMGTNDRRKSLIKSRWYDLAKLKGVDPNNVDLMLQVFADYFAYIAESDFLNGRVEAKDKKPFKASFDWVLNSTNYLKIIEQNYHGEQQ